MDITIDELRAGWEQIREKVKALELTAQFYAERNQQLIDENRELKTDYENMTGAGAACAEQIVQLEDKVTILDELLWRVTALASQFFLINHPIRELLATQGYTRENLEKR